MLDYEMWIVTIKDCVFCKIYKLAKNYEVNEVR